MFMSYLGFVERVGHLVLSVLLKGLDLLRQGT